MYNIFIALEVVQITLSNISTSVTGLQTSAASLNEALQNISTNVNNTISTCMNLCGTLNAGTFENGLNNDFQQVFLVVYCYFLIHFIFTDIVTKYY